MSALLVSCVTSQFLLLAMLYPSKNQLCFISVLVLVFLYYMCGVSFNIMFQRAI